MSDILKYELGGIAALAEFGTLAAYSQDIIGVYTTAIITLGIGTFITVVSVTDFDYECLKNMKKNADEIYRNLING